MAKRWFIVPVIFDPTLHGGCRRPKCAEFVDPATGRKYPFTCSISNGAPGKINDWCVVIVAGQDFTPFEADSDIIPILEGINIPDAKDREPLLKAKLKDRVPSQAKRGKMLGKLASKGHAFHHSATCSAIVSVIAKTVNPTFNPYVEDVKDA